MFKLKPPWKETNIPKNAKIKLWRIMRDNPTYRAWQTIAESTELDSEEKQFVGYSRETYNRLRKEIHTMPVSEVQSLPFDLQVWIEELRPDLKGKLKASDIAKDQTPATATEAKFRHWAELVDVAEKLRDVLSIPGLHWYWLPTTYNYDESDTLLSEWSEKYSALLTNWSMDEPIVRDADPLIFGSLLLHLQAESPKFQLKTLVEWRVSSRKVIVECIKFIIDTFKQGLAELRFDFDEIIPDDIKGMLENLWGIVPLTLLIPSVWSEYQKKCEAEGEPDPRLSWLDFWSNQQIKHLSLSEPAKRLTDAIDRINKDAQQQRDFLTLLIHRRTFSGTCSICESWAT